MTEGVAGRLRRLRGRSGIRELVAESGLALSHLVYPVFVTEAPARPPPRGLPDLAARTPEETARRVSGLARRGLSGVLLFGVPRRKDPKGRGAWSPAGPVPRALRAIRERCPDIALFADVCLCEYTTHGHCGVLSHGSVDNDRTLPLLARCALAYADAGADMVAPSAMMDHQVRALREALDGRGHSSVGILAYAAKFSSAFYGPFREAVDSAPAFGDRKGYQLDPRNRREALRELRGDAEEGADVLMVKPALPYLDVLVSAQAELSQPLAAFQVSGEYAMVRAAAARGWVDEGAAIAETLGAMRRAGASLIISYFTARLVAGFEEAGR